VRWDTPARLTHSLGKGYRDLIRVRHGRVPHPVDAVLYPGTPQEVRAILDWAHAQSVAVIPFGGGSSVVGGVEGYAGNHHAAVAVDMTRLNRVVHIDPIAQTVHTKVGITGPALEAAVANYRLTLGHFPQSFEFSTLGGWIATRSAGYASTGYGKIEDMVLGICLEAPAGTLQTSPVPASAAGPSVVRLIAGSEGTLGIITEAILRLRRAPVRRDYRGLLVPSFHDGLELGRALMQEDIIPTTFRLSDAEETIMMFALSQGKGRESFPIRLGSWLLTKKGYRLGQASLVIIGYEGDHAVVRSAWQRARDSMHRHGAVDLGHGVGEAWFRERYVQPYLRDALLDHGILVDTLETATVWSNLPTLYAHVTAAIRTAIETSGSPAMVMAHVSHLYHTGASLYVTFLGRQTAGHEEEQWELIKKAASDAIVAGGGTISHHHGVGLEHRAWIQAEYGDQGIAILRALKQALDPAGIMNPGKLLP